MRSISITLCISMLLIIGGGCGSNLPTSLERSILEYHHGQWLLSEMWAEKSLDEHLQIDESQYMMGLCEFRLRRLDSANQWFLQAAKSSNPKVRGKANAMIGIIASSKGDFDVANIAFQTATIDLEGKDKREAESRSTSVSDIQPKSYSSNFTLQFGAYRDKKNATAYVTSINPTLNKLGLNEAWITEEKDRLGRTMFLVHAGQFSTRTSASARRKRGDLPQCIVVESP
ncbi:MAG: SPOR domain-containing protein [Planctomycetota bacterium]|nr:SPOR domain-containing protein [Planctomycetota bacterium]